MNSEIVAAIAHGFNPIWPEAILIFAACVLFLGGTFRTNRNLWGTAALVSLAIALIALYLQKPLTSINRADLYAGPLVLDRLAFYVKVLALGSGGVLVLFIWNQVADA